MVDSLGPLPTIHPRENTVREATQALLSAWLEISRELTAAERLRVAAAFVSDTVGGIARHAIRAERHPDDPDHPGGLA